MEGEILVSKLLKISVGFFIVNCLMLNIASAFTDRSESPGCSNSMRRLAEAEQAVRQQNLVAAFNIANNTPSR